MTPTGDERKSDMPIVVNLDVMMAKRKISAGELAEKVGITPANAENRVAACAPKNRR